MITLPNFTIFVMLVSTSFAYSVEPIKDKNRFNGQYQLVQTKRSNSFHKSARCPEPKLISREGNVTTLDARQKCEFSDWKETTAQVCGEDLFINEASISNGAKPTTLIYYSTENSDVSKFGNSNFRGYQSQSNILYGILDDNDLDTNTCKISGDNFFIC
jgi:hypothetical protein